jgi:hypothetical protein
MQSVRWMLAKWCPIYERALVHEPLFPSPGSKRGVEKQRFTPEQRDTIIARLRTGESPYRICNDYGVCESVIRYYKKKL